MYVRRNSHQMHFGHSPLKSVINAFQHRFQFGQVDAVCAVCGRNQHASSMIELLFFSETPVIKELALIQTSTSRISTHQARCTGPFLYIFMTASSNIVLGLGSSILSFHPGTIEFAFCLINAVAIWSQPNIGKWPIIAILYCAIYRLYFDHKGVIFTSNYYNFSRGSEQA